MQCKNKNCSMKTDGKSALIVSVVVAVGFVSMFLLFLILFVLVVVDLF